MGVQELWEDLKTRSKQWVDTLSQHSEDTYQRTSQWLDSFRLPSPNSDPVEVAVKARRRFLKDVHFVYRLNFVVMTTGVVFITAPGLLRRVGRAGIVGVLGVLLVCPELTPLKVR